MLHDFYVAMDCENSKEQEEEKKKYAAKKSKNSC